MATVLPSIVTQYAKAVYRDHSRTFEAVPVSYKQPVIEYAAHNYYIETIQGALETGMITQQQYDDTMLLKTEADPQHDPYALI